MVYPTHSLEIPWLTKSAEEESFVFPSSISPFVLESKIFFAPNVIFQVEPGSSQETKNSSNSHSIDAG